MQLGRRELRVSPCRHCTPHPVLPPSWNHSGPPSRRPRNFMLNVSSHSSGPACPPLSTSSPFVDFKSAARRPFDRFCTRILWRPYSQNSAIQPKLAGPTLAYHVRSGCPGARFAIQCAASAVPPRSQRPVDPTYERQSRTTDGIGAPST